MKTNDVISYFGNPKAVADALGIRVQAIYQWGDTVPFSRQFQLQILSRGKLKAEPIKATA